MSPISFKPSAFDIEPDQALAIQEKERIWSPQQERVRQWVRNERGNLVLVARAGTGKSTTLVSVVLPELTGFVDIAVFNKKAERDLSNKVAQAQEKGISFRYRGLQVGTFHKFGLSAWRRAAPNVRIEGHNDSRGDAAGYYKFERIATELQIEKHLQYFVKKLMSMMKQRALGVIAPVTAGACRDIVDHFDMEEALYDEHGKPKPNHEALVEEGVVQAIKALEHSNKLSPEVIDFDDMIYAPLHGNCKVFQVDWLLGDEMQDTNPARRTLCKRMLRPGGRFIAVADPAQAIQGFTGADNDSVDIIKRQFACMELPLSVSFRCPKSGIRMAQKWVPDIEAAPDAIEGTVERMNLDQFGKIEKFDVTDAILCRNNAPLVDLAYALIKKGIACHVEGREIGQGLMVLAQKWKVARLEALVDRLRTYKEREVGKLMMKGHEASADGLADRVDTLLALISGMPAGSTVNDLRTRIESMFQDSDGKRAQRLTLCSVHKSKGLEWRKVYLLGRNKYMPSKYARQDWQLQQERHLQYVAETRHMEAFVEVAVR